MSTRSHGTQIHAVLQTFEHLSSRLQRMGVDQRQADRAGLFIALTLDGRCTKDQAWDLVDELYPREETKREPLES